MLIRMLTKMNLIHYGSSKLEISHFKQISNIRGHGKPRGGLWASPVESAFGWKQLCEREYFRTDHLTRHFIFQYEGNILVIDGAEDLKNIVWARDDYNVWAPNYEEMVKLYDAIYLTKQGKGETKVFRGKSLYDWDCECVLIMNPKGFIINKE